MLVFPDFSTSTLPSPLRLSRRTTEPEIWILRREDIDSHRRRRLKDQLSKVRGNETTVGILLFEQTTQTSNLRRKRHFGARSLCSFSYLAGLFRGREQPLQQANGERRKKCRSRLPDGIKFTYVT